MESHGRLKEKKLYIYIHYLVTKKASIFLASDFSVLVCFVCLVFFRFTNRLVFWRIVLLSISYSCYSISQQVFGLLAHHHLPLRPSQGEILDTFSPNNQATP